VAARAFKRGDVLTLYDGLVSKAGALLYDGRQDAYFDPKTASGIAARAPVVLAPARCDRARALLWRTHCPDARPIALAAIPR
jgi:hypothetical protein